MSVISEKMVKDWANCYVETKVTGVDLIYPSETLIRLLKGDYLTGERPDYKDKKILDVGFGEANNLLFFAAIGMDAHGVEIHQTICDQAKEKFDKRGLSVKLNIGSNQNLPYPNNHFDYLVSWNVLHYEGSEEGVLNSLKEYHRVLKPGGRLLLSTTGPQHKILLNSKTLGHHRYEINRPGDFRQGQVHFFFDTKRYITFYFTPFFDELQIGRIEDQLFREKLDWWLITGLKNEA